MKTAHASRRFVFMALAAIAPLTSAVSTFAQGRNCPESHDQTIALTPGHPTTFSLDVENGETAQISIFQYPLGGVLQQTGASPLEFVFTPQYGFNGSTEFTYRIIPPYDCNRTVQLGRVQLVGGYADSTAAGLVPTVPHTVCGVGSFAPLTLSVLTIATAGGRRRRKTAWANRVPSSN